MIEEKRETVGSISLELSQQKPQTQSPIELEKSMQENYMNELIYCVHAARKNLVGDFFVVVITKNEKLMPNVFRNYFMSRISCPTPDYDQSVYKYHANEEKIEYVWTIPSREASFYLKDNADLVDESEHELLRFVLDFASGELAIRGKKLNGEKIDSILLEA